MAKAKHHSEPTPSIFDEPLSQETPEQRLKREATESYKRLIARNGRYNPYGLASDKHGNSFK